ncbi:monocarboxylate transporter 12-B-like [Homarus americanus]
MNSEEGFTENRILKNTDETKITEDGHKKRISYSSTVLRQDSNANEKQWPVKKEVKEKEEEDAATEMVPPDGGWGWMVALGSFVIMTLIPMVSPCFGVLFSRYLMEQGASSTTTAWIFNSQCCIWNLMAIITRPVTKEFGWRKIGIFGAALAAVSFVISAFAPCPEFLFFSFSLLCGVGGGMVVSICFLIVPIYFDRRRGVATAIMMAGVCLGQMLGPPIARFLQDEYGFRGATLMVGGIILNGCLGASFFHPVEQHMKKGQPQAGNQPLAGEAPLLPPEPSTLGSRSRELVKCHSELSLTDSTGDPDFDLMRIAVRSRMMKSRAGRHLSDASTISISRNNSSLCISTLDVAGIIAMPDTDQNDPSNLDSDDSKKTLPSICSVVFRVFQSTVADMGILRSPRACIIALSGTFGINGYLNFMMMVPFAMQAAGQTLEDSAYCISISALCNLLMRLLVATLSDWPRFNKRLVYVSGYFTVSLSILVFPFLTELPWLMAAMALFGCGVGANMGLYTLVMIDVMGLDNLPPVFGASCFMVAMGFIILGPIIGIIRDSTNSYSLSIWVVAGMLLTSFMLWIFMPAAIRYDERKMKEREEKEKSKP